MIETLWPLMRLVFFFSALIYCIRFLRKVYHKVNNWMAARMYEERAMKELGAQLRREGYKP